MNQVIIAAAGSGKTTRIVTEILKAPTKKSLIVTYTLNNVNEIRQKFYHLNRHIPSTVTVISWFSFLLRDVVRPYQNYIYEKRIGSIAFIDGRSAKFVNKSNFKKYFLSEEDKVYTDKISELGLICNEKSNGLVIDRLEDLYDHIYIDEVQDLAGYDLDVIELLLSSRIGITLVGDHRQATFQTNFSNRNKQYSGVKIIDKFHDWEKQKRCQVEYTQNCYRCNQVICNLADALYADLPKTNSENNTSSGHDGVFIVRSDKIHKYIQEYSPKLLRYNVKTDCYGYENNTINWGDSKGLTFDRVLILPHGPLKKALKAGDLSQAASSAAKLYVAITRARFSVAFVFDDQCPLQNVVHYEL